MSCDLLALEMNEVKSLNDKGIDTQWSYLYWAKVNVADRTFYSLEMKPHVPYELGEGEFDAPTYLELISILPTSVDLMDEEADDVITFKLTVYIQDSNTEIAYANGTDIWHSENDYDPNMAVYKMIMWFIDNEIGLKQR